jgi:hypothetical protein
MHPALERLPHPAPIKPEPKKTIWQALADKLGRDPTHAESCAEVKRILTESKG